LWPDSLKKGQEQGEKGQELIQKCMYILGNAIMQHAAYDLTDLRGSHTCIGICIHGLHVVILQ